MLTLLLLAAAPAVCETGAVAPRSYRMVTEAQAVNLNRDRYHWEDAFFLGKHEEALADLNEEAMALAERALRLDPGNAMAWSILARQALALEDAERGEEAFSRAFAAGLPVVWSGTLYDVDARTYFYLAFSPDDLRVYTMAALGGPVERGFYGIPKFPGPENERLYRAWAGCLDPSARPEAVIPWADVTEIKAGNWVLWFKLRRAVTIASDRTGKAKKVDQIKVALHGATGSLEVYKPVGSDEPALRGRGPAGFQDLVRRTLVKFVDRDHHMKLPPLKPGVGW